MDLGRSGSVPQKVSSYVKDQLIPIPQYFGLGYPYVYRRDNNSLPPPKYKCQPIKPCLMFVEPFIYLLRRKVEGHVVAF